VISALNYYLKDQNLKILSTPEAGKRLKRILGREKGTGWDKFSDVNRYKVKVKSEVAALASLMDAAKLPRQ